MRQKFRPLAAHSAFILLSTACFAVGFALSPRNGPIRASLWSVPALVPSRDRFFIHRDVSMKHLSAERPSRSATGLALSVPRAGAFFTEALTKSKRSPAAVFDTLLAALSVTAVSLKALEKFNGGKTGDKVTDSEADEKRQAVKSLQFKYLLAFWLLRGGYWMSGSYVYAAYSSKAFNGAPASLALVSKIFLCGFLSTAIFGPSVGKATDQYGRKKGTLAFSLLYSIGVLSIKSDLLWVLFAGRAILGIALGLLFCAPEAWVAGEATRLGLQKYLGETFSLAYEGDSLVAIVVGKFAGMAANARGPTGPFDLSIWFLAAGALVSGLLWRENSALDGKQAVQSQGSTKSEDGKEAAQSKGSKNSEDCGKNSATVAEVLDIIRRDPKLMLIGSVQSFFEAAMYVFILQWPPAVSQAVTTLFGGDAVTPYGTIFACFMSCSLLGSLFFGQLNKKKAVPEDTTSGMLIVATVAMAVAAHATRMPSVPFSGLVAAFFVFEACVGMYFPAMGTLRSKLVPDSHKSLILSLFGIPLNLMVVAIFLSVKHLGISGALGVAAGGLALAAASMLRLGSIMKTENT